MEKLPLGFTFGRSPGLAKATLANITLALAIKTLAPAIKTLAPAITTLALALFAGLPGEGWGHFGPFHTLESMETHRKFDYDDFWPGGLREAL